MADEIQVNKKLQQFSCLTTFIGHCLLCHLSDTFPSINSQTRLTVIWNYDYKTNVCFRTALAASYASIRWHWCNCTPPTSGTIPSELILPLTTPHFTTKQNGLEGPKLDDDYYTTFWIQLDDCGPGVSIAPSWLRHCEHQCHPSPSLPCTGFQNDTTSP
jgi:hypothetical protein